MASRSAGPFVGRHFLLERHFAGEMISVGKARRCPFKKSFICVKGKLHFEIISSDMIDSFS